MCAGKSANKHHARDVWASKMVLCLYVIKNREPNCEWTNLIIRDNVAYLDAQQGLKGPRITVMDGTRTIFVKGCSGPRLPLDNVRDQERYLREYYTGDRGRAIGQKEEDSQEAVIHEEWWFTGSCDSQEAVN